MTYQLESKTVKGTVLTLRDLTILDVVEIEDQMTTMTKDGMIIPQVGKAKLAKFLRGLVSWDRIQVDGAALAVSEENKLKLPAALYNEVVDEINRRSQLSGSDEGK